MTGNTQMKWIAQGSDSTSGTDKRQRISISIPTLGSSNATAAGDEASDMAWHGEAAAHPRGLKLIY